MQTPVIPQNIEAEIGLLGSILIDQSVYNKVEGIIFEDDFSDNKNRLIFASIQDLFKQGKSIDITSLISELENKNNLDKCGGLEYISSLANTYYSVSNVDTYIQIVEESSLRRKTLKLLQSLVEQGFRPNVSTTEYLENIEQSVFDLSKKRKIGTFTSIKEVTGTVIEKAEQQSKQKETVVGLKTGFHDLDKYTLGFQPGQLIILAARPGMGKSAFALNLAANIASKNKNGRASVAIFSLEMPKEQLVERMIASDSKINSKDIKTGNLRENEWMRIQAAATHLNGLNIYFSDDSDINVSKIKSVSRQLKELSDLDFIIIDYLQLINTEGTARSTNDEVAKITRSLKIMAQELNVPILALSQLSRLVERREEKKPILSDLRDSGSIEQDADIVMFLFRDEIYTKQNSTRKGEADLIIAKNRSGQLTSEDGIPLLFNGAFSLFSDKVE